MRRNNGRRHINAINSFAKEAFSRTHASRQISSRYRSSFFSLPSLPIVSPNLMALRNDHYPVNNYPNFGRSSRSGRFSMNFLK